METVLQFLLEHGIHLFAITFLICLLFIYWSHALQKQLTKKSMTIEIWDRKARETHQHLEQQLAQREELVRNQCAELETRKQQYPEMKKNVYRIAVIGIANSGKSALMLKLVDPIFADVNAPTSTIYQEYDRTVSVILNSKDNLLVQHVLRIIEWGGEHSDKAVSKMMGICQDTALVGQCEGEIIHPGIQAIIIVVDLGILAQDDPDIKGGKGHDKRNTLNEQRIQRQYDYYFHPRFLDVLFVEEIMTSCRTVVLFINKSDLLPGTADEVEQQAEKYFAPLRANIEKKYPGLKVIVGSASTDHGTRKLFAHLVQAVLPSEAHDLQMGILERLHQEQDMPPSGHASFADHSAVHAADLLRGLGSFVGDESAESVRGVG